MCEANVQCSALYVEDMEEADSKEQEAYEALVEAGFADMVPPIDEDSGRRLMQEDCITDKTPPPPPNPSPPPPVPPPASPPPPVPVSPTWASFEAARSQGDLTLAPILDFSYAGYDHGESGIPTAMGATAA